MNERTQGFLVCGWFLPGLSSKLRCSVTVNKMRLSELKCPIQAHDGTEALIPSAAGLWALLRAQSWVPLLEGHYPTQGLLPLRGHPDLPLTILTSTGTTLNGHSRSKCPRARPLLQLYYSSTSSSALCRCYFPPSSQLLFPLGEFPTNLLRRRLKSLRFYFWGNPTNNKNYDPKFFL